MEENWGVKVLNKEPSTRSISGDLNRYNLPDDIKITADEIYRKMTLLKVHRKKRRLQLIWYCVYNAYKELCRAVYPETLCEIIGISLEDARGAISRFSHIRSGYKPPEEQDLFKFITLYCGELSVDNYQPINKLAEQLVEKDPSYYDCTPQHVALAIVKYYLTINGVSTRKLQDLHKPNANVDELYRRIADTDNNE